MYRAYFVDDEPHALKRLTESHLLNDCGYQVIGSSTSPVLALDEIRKLNPDVVFTDLKMPDMSGVELMEKLRGKGAEYEFVIISAFGEYNAIRNFFQQKGFDYLLKPVLDDDLQTLLEKLSGRLASKRAAPGLIDSPSAELNSMIIYLKENLSAKHTLESLSKQFETNYTYICDLFASNLGTTFSSYLTKLRMEAAAEFLKDKSINVKEIAGLCGYEYLYFVKVFKKYYACSPTSYREGLE